MSPFEDQPEGIKQFKAAATKLAPSPQNNEAAKEYTMLLRQWLGFPLTAYQEDRLADIIRSACEKAVAERDKVAWCEVHEPTTDEPITVCPCCEAVNEHAKVKRLMIEIVKREIDNCDHPECGIERKKRGYSSCAGGHIARQVVAAMRKE